MGFEKLEYKEQYRWSHEKFDSAYTVFAGKRKKAAIIMVIMSKNNHMHACTHAHTYTHACELFQVFPIVGHTNFSITVCVLSKGNNTGFANQSLSERSKCNGAYFGTNLIKWSEDHYSNVPVLRYIAPDFNRLLFISTTHNALNTQ